MRREWHVLQMRPMSSGKKFSEHRSNKMLQNFFRQRFFLRFDVGDSFDSYTSTFTSCFAFLQVFISASGRVKHVMRVHNSRGIPVVSSAPFTDSREAPDNIVIDPETGTHRVKCPFQHRDGAVILVKTVKDFRDHISIDHPDKEKCCLICAKPFGTKGELVEHLQAHSGNYKLQSLQ